MSNIQEYHKLLDRFKEKFDCAFAGDSELPEFLKPENIHPPKEVKRMTKLLREPMRKGDLNAISRVVREEQESRSNE